MDKRILLTLALGAMSQVFAHAWEPKGDKIKTVWAEQVTPENVWQSYPRPQLQRAEWINLNGLWKYAVTDQNTSRKNVSFEGEILVPFAIESSLSGVQKTFLPTDKLWYQREFTLDPSWKNKSTVLHFGAVDYECQVWVNNRLVGTHKGGNNPFSFDITKYLKKSGPQSIEVAVTDPTDTESISRGKQQLNQEGIWYTPVSGIWQTVWLEAVNKTYIRQVLPSTDIERKSVKLAFDIIGAKGNEEVKIEVLDDGKVIKTVEQKLTNAMEIDVPNAVLWSPESPKLYHLNIVLSNGGRVLDRVKSYFALRKVDARKDECGYNRICLNNQPIFQYGPLDQGWWPDGLLTPPSEEAMLWDMVQLKKMGFNMIRKHIKVEPARWYTYCDQIGLIVWQDMPSGDKSPEWQNRKYFEGTELTRSAESEETYRKEWKEVIDCLYSYPCIGTWVPFNEAWGQFKTREIAEWTKQYDPSRLVNPASGGNHYTCGDMLDLHHYPGPEMFLYDAQRATVLGEYGGIGLVLKDHLWEPNRNWGYIQFNTSAEATAEYLKYAGILKDMISRGFSAAVYTQTTDVEVEVNGLMTYDRKVIKLDESKLKKMNTEICNSLK